MRSAIYKNLRLALLHKSQSNFLAKKFMQTKGVYIVCSQFTGFLWLYGNDFHASFDRYSCIKPVFSHTNIYLTKKMKPLEYIQEFVLCHYHNKSGQNSCPLLSVRYHSTFETFKQIIWNAIPHKKTSRDLTENYLRKIIKNKHDLTEKSQENPL